MSQLKLVNRLYPLYRKGLQICCCCVSCSVMSQSLRPYGLQSARLLCPWNSSGKNTGVGNHSLLQVFFQIQGLTQGLLHCRQILYCLSHQGSPIDLLYCILKKKRKRLLDYQIIPSYNIGSTLFQDFFLVGNTSQNLIFKYKSITLMKSVFYLKLLHSIYCILHILVMNCSYQAYFIIGGGGSQQFSLKNKHQGVTSSEGAWLQWQGFARVVIPRSKLQASNLGVELDKFVHITDEQTYLFSLLSYLYLTMCNY